MESLVFSVALAVSAITFVFAEIGFRFLIDISEDEKSDDADPEDSYQRLFERERIATGSMWQDVAHHWLAWFFLPLPIVRALFCPIMCAGCSRRCPKWSCRFGGLSHAVNDVVESLVGAKAW